MTTKAQVSQRSGIKQLQDCLSCSLEVAIMPCCHLGMTRVQYPGPCSSTFRAWKYMVVFCTYSFQGLLRQQSHLQFSLLLLHYMKKELGPRLAQKYVVSLGNIGYHSWVVISVLKNENPSEFKWNRTLVFISLSVTWSSEHNIIPHLGLLICQTEF